MTNIDEVFSPNGENEVATKKYNRIISILGLLIFLVGFIIFLRESWSLQNTINNHKYWWIGASIGVIIFAGIIIFFKIKYPNVLKEKKRRNWILCSYFFGSIFLVLGIMGFIDTAFANPQVECKDFTVTGKDFSTSTYGFKSYFIHCNNNGEDVMMQIDKQSWDEIKENQTIELNLKQGFLGREYVASFQIPKQ